MNISGYSFFFYEERNRLVFVFKIEEFKKYSIFLGSRGLIKEVSSGFRFFVLVFVLLGNDCLFILMKSYCFYG